MQQPAARSSPASSTRSSNATPTATIGAGSQGMTGTSNRPGSSASTGTSQPNRQTASQPAQPAQTPRPPTPQNGYTVAQIFQFQEWQPREQDLPPRLNETQPISLFWFADKHLAKAVAGLQKVRDIDSESFKRRNERVHRAQSLLLETIYLIYTDMDEDMKASRQYRRQLPADDQRELEGGFSENILFAAQALSRGFRIRGIEEYTAELYEPARQLHSAIEMLRAAFTRRALACSSPPYFDLYPVMKEFDTAWTLFEQKICFCYFSVTYGGRAGRAEELDMFQVLMSETIIRAVHCGYITWPQVHTFDPVVIFAVPRLCIVSALHHMPDCVNITDPDRGLRWFKNKVPLLQQIQKELRMLGEEQLSLLEKMLADSDAGHDDAGGEKDVVEVQISSAAEGRDGPLRALSAGSSQLTMGGEAGHVAQAEGKESHAGRDGTGASQNASPLADSATQTDFKISHGTQTSDLPLHKLPTTSTPPPAAATKAAVQPLFRDICRVADDLQSGPQARDFVGILHKVFSMHQEESEEAKKDDKKRSHHHHRHGSHAGASGAGSSSGSRSGGLTGGKTTVAGGGASSSSQAAGPSFSSAAGPSGSGAMAGLTGRRAMDDAANAAATALDPAPTRSSSRANQLPRPSATGSARVTATQ
ncbi:uncharacterized protein EV422DRAFT_570571 [Fimicolochytrium jonesii]|uniref:uncharacterized protein n=1 Tax=Fimicolochytrium jonesii TaxID=1396493 RepID=UPI0022FE8E11|nr:uncharacterized protein EV422DRAFT_570571 [Fimicolochytrium jonesii]KAI8817524.1 hypothetical protein EV422DRAFT_570571 [Fimicolochytrium jonesii]